MPNRLLHAATLLTALVAVVVVAFAASASEAAPASERRADLADGAKALAMRVAEQRRSHARAVRRWREAAAAARREDIAIRTQPDLAASSPVRIRRAAGMLERRVRNVAPPSPESVGVSSATLEAIAACESGGNPAAVNAAGYYGKYQFSPPTWAAVGGTGNPAAASEAEQDYRAALLYARSGPGQWPVCGR